jgi:hypothetical protein
MPSLCDLLPTRLRVCAAALNTRPPRQLGDFVARLDLATGLKRLARATTIVP